MGCTTSKPDQVIEPYYKTYPSSSPNNYAVEPNDSYTGYNNSTSISDDMLKFLQELDRSNSINSNNAEQQQQHFPPSHAVHSNDHPSTTTHNHTKAEQVRDVGKYIHSLDKDQLDNHSATTTGLRRIASPSETGLIGPQSHSKPSSFVKRLFIKKAPSNSIADSSKVSSQYRKIVSSASAAADSSLSFSPSSYELALKELADADPSLAFRQAAQESEAWDHAGMNEAIKPASSAYDRALRELNAELESRHADDNDDDDDDDVGPSSLVVVKHEPQTEEFGIISPRPKPGVEAQGKRKIKPRDDPLAKFVKLCPPGGERSVVLYTTSLRGIRKTFEDCNTIRRVIESLFVHIDERDVALHQGFRNELKEMMQGASLGSIPMPVPRLFIDGRYIGGAEEVLQLHEEEKLLPLLEGMPRERSQGQPCDGCGGVRFVPCLNCSGSRKVVQTNTQNVIRCPECNENGLIHCPICS